jgi:SWIM zinc finger
MSTTAAAETRYTVRDGAGGQVRVQKWQHGQGKVATYWVEAHEWWQRCSCATWQYRRGVCKHIQLVNLIDSGRLKGGPYVWNGQVWEGAEPASAANTGKLVRR